MVQGREDDVGALRKSNAQKTVVPRFDPSCAGFATIYLKEGNSHLQSHLGFTLVR